ncbi:MAG: PadR family transcriptional regulator [Methanomassiliicoccus sp.]|nr:PadR family transcriptional regulator [Methanomassiliicoccus sp.]
MANLGTPCNKGLKETFNLTTFHSGFLKLAILKLVSVRPMHGYALMKEIYRLSDRTWKPSPGSVYPALGELQSLGLIIQEVDGRKRVYRLTSAGEDVLADAVLHTQNGIRSLQGLLDYQPLDE